MPLPQSLITELMTAKTPLQRATSYAKHGIWFDTLTELAQLRLDQPQNQAAKQVWTELLSDRALQLEAIADQSRVERDRDQFARAGKLIDQLLESGLRYSARFEEIAATPACIAEKSEARPLLVRKAAAFRNRPVHSVASNSPVTWSEPNWTSKRPLMCSAALS